MNNDVGTYIITITPPSTTENINLLWQRERGNKKAEFPWTLYRRTDGRTHTQQTDGWFSVQMLHEGTLRHHFWILSAVCFVLFCCIIQYDIHTTDHTDFTHHCLSLLFYGYFTLISLNWNECVAQFVTVRMSSVTTFNPQSLSVPPTKRLKHTKSTQLGGSATTQLEWEKMFS